MRRLLGYIAVAISFVSITVPEIAMAQDKPMLDVGFSMSTLGLGVAAAKPLTHRSDVRGEFNFFDYNKTFNKDGTTYGGQLSLRSATVVYDQFLLGGLHISGGAMLWNGNKGSATISVPGGNSFTLGGVTYYSSTSAPATGTGALTFRKAAPMLLLGYGNLVKKGHFMYSMDLGVVFQGSPVTTLAMTGNVCDSSGTICQSIAGTPAVQSNVVAEQNKLNNDLSPFKYYPVLQLTFGYKFK